jgi:glycerol-3-phosphate dehydrogenase (NAD(P)+)
MRSTRNNEIYLNGFPFPSQLHVATDIAEALREWRSGLAESQVTNAAVPSDAQGLLVLATPLSGLTHALSIVRTELGEAREGEGFVWLAKGLALDPSDAKTLRWPHEMAMEACPGWPCGALSGPSFAQEVAAGLPVALTLASDNLEWARFTAQQLHGGGMRVYASSDLIGVELGGAMKNVLAIAAGVCDGLQLGANARAALLTRGLSEMARLGQAIGAQTATFMGLATLGDLILTATGDLSRNRRVGLALAKGQSIDEIIRGLGHVAEGVATAHALLALAQRHGVDVPITESVSQLIAGRWSASQAIDQLMSREPRDEYVG